MALAFNVSDTYVFPSFSLLGKKVFVTGGSRGIGRACALTLAAAGADVAVGSSPAGADSAEDVCGEIRELGRRAQAYAFDVGARGDVETMCARVERRLRGDRHPGQQRRRHPRRPVPQDGSRRLGRGDQHEPEQRVRRHPTLHRPDGGARLGPRHQHLQHRRPRRQLRAGELRRREGRA